MISEDTIRKVLDVAQIEEVIGDYVTLKKKGVNYVGLCPFHKEKTPSFYVHPAKGIFKCFGCGKGGNVVSFLMEHEKFNFPEAIKYLAGKYHIEIEEEQTEGHDDENELLKESIYIVNDFAARFFTDQLFNTEKGRAVGLTYFKERGYLENTIKKFLLGYVPDSENVLYRHAVDAGYKPAMLEKAGLLKNTGSGYRDFFHSRIMFPIQNLSGKIVAFAGRTLITDKKIPKYINTPENEVYIKGKTLYGLYQARTAIRHKDECLLVEGYTDVISLHQAGIEHVVASAGTALTSDQVALIRRFTKNITIIYDGDEAGRKAMGKGIGIILEAGMNVKVVLLPEDEDPDSYIRKAGATGFLEYIQKNQTDFILFKARDQRKAYLNDPRAKSELIREITRLIALVPGHIERSVYVKECAGIMEIDEQVLIHEVNHQRHKHLIQKRKQTSTETGNSIDEAPIAPEVRYDQKTLDTPVDDTLYEREIIRILLTFGAAPVDEDRNVTVADIIFSEKGIGAMSFTTPVYNKILSLYREQYEKGKIPDERYFFNLTDEEIVRTASSLLHTPYELSEIWHQYGIRVSDHHAIYKRDLQVVLSRYKLTQIRKKLDFLMRELHEAEQTGNTDRALQILEKLRLIKEAEKQLCEIIGMVVLK